MPLVFDDPSLVYDVNTPLIIEASAGSGKTTILTERWVATFVYQMAWENKEPVEALAAMVALTFTRKAASEMKERIRIRLDELFEDDGLSLLLQNLQQYNSPKINFLEAQQSLLAHQESIEDLISAATIGTIDSFINASLKQNPLELDEDWGFDPEGTDQIELDVQNQLVYDCLYSRTPDDLSHYFRLGASLCGFKEWLNFFAVMRILSRNLGIDNLKTALVDSQLLSPTFSRVESLTDVYQHFLHQKTQNLLHALNNEAQEKPLLTKNKDLHRILSEIDHDNFVLLYQKKLVSAYSHAPVQKDPLRSLREECEQAALHLADGLTSSLISLVFPLLQEYEARLQTQNKAQGKSSFSRNARLFIDALRAGALTQKLHTRIKYFFADEFQDTSDQQATMFSIIADQAVAFYVGDPKQSIYLFRGADTTVFQRTTQMFQQKNWKTAVLSKNYRSSTLIVETNNRLFSQIFSNDPTITYTPQSSQKVMDNSCFHYTHMLESDTKKEESNLTLYTQVLSLIQKELSSSREPGDIMVLFQNNRDILNFYNFAKQNDPELPVSSSNRSQLFASPYIAPILLFLTVIDAPADELNLIALLKSLFFRCDDIQINQWLDKARTQGKILYDVLPIEQKTLINRLASIKNRMPLDEMLDLLLEQTEYEAILQHDPPEALASLNLFRQEIQTLYLSKNISLSTFLETIEEELAELSEAEFSGGEGKNIRLMTIHSSKGLESPCVIFAFKESRILKKSNAFLQKTPPLPLQSKNRLAFETFGKGSLHQAISQQQSQELFAESKRLLYVALTRAKESLYVCGLPLKPDTDTLYNSHIFNQGLFSQLFTQGKINEFPLNPYSATQEPRDPNKEQHRYEELKAWETAHPLSLIPQSLSVSLLLDAEFSPSSVWHKFYGVSYAENLRDVGGEESTFALVTPQEIGTMVHGLLQQFDKAPSQTLHQFLSKQYPTWESGFEESIQLANSYWNSSFYQELAQADAKDKERCVQMMIPKGVIVRAVADLYVADDRKIIVDYKLNMGKNSDRYRRQMEYYALMSEKSGYPVDELVLFDLTKGQEHRFSWDKTATQKAFSEATNTVLEILSKPEGSSPAP
ncbi:MAG: UvrD-helicase domain-containing protein [Brevinema sp.]